MVDEVAVKTDSVDDVSRRVAARREDDADDSPFAAYGRRDSIPRNESQIPMLPAKSNNVIATGDDECEELDADVGFVNARDADERRTADARFVEREDVDVFEVVPISKWKLVYYTVILYLSFIGLGMAVAVLGPTLVDLSVILQTPLEDMGLVFVARSSGYLIGSILVALIFDHGRLQIFGAVNVLSGLCVCMALFTQHFWSFNAFICLSGICTGIIDAGGNVMLLSLWETGSAPYMQALHFFFGLGAFFAPLISEPFLVSNWSSAAAIENIIHQQQLNSTDGASMLVTVAGPPTSANSSSILGDLSGTTAILRSGSNDSSLSSTITGSAMKIVANYSETAAEHVEANRATVFASIQIPYIIIMVWMVVLGLAFWQVAVSHWLKGTKSPFDRRTSSSVSSQPDPEQGGQVPFSLPVLVKWFTIIVMSTFFFFYVGMEVAFGQLVFTFGVSSGSQMSKEEAAFVNSAYWGAYTAMRLACIFVAICVPPLTMMAVDFGLVTVAAIVLLAAAETKIGLWIGSALLGIGFASVFPTGIVWYESHVPVTSKIASVFLIGSAAGEMTVPYLASSLMPANPMSLVYIVCGVDVGCILAFVTVVIVLRKTSYRS